jgi:hypothetical protein
MFQYWEESPPVHELVAAYLGYKSSKKKKDAKLTEADHAFIRTLGPQQSKTFDQLPLHVQEWLAKSRKEPTNGA